MIKALSDNFFNRFLDGDLSELIDFLHGRPQFKLNLCGSHVTIYYKGMPTIEIHENDENDVFWLTRFAYMASAEKLDPKFEEKISSSDFLKKPLYKLVLSNIGWWNQLLTDIASGIDKFALDIPVSGVGDEQKNQDILHNIVIENNAYTNFNSTDYFIIDIEHTTLNNQTNEKLQAVAMHWPENITTNPSAPLGLAFIDFKTGTDSMETIKFPKITDKDFNDIEKAVTQMCKLYLISVPGIDDVATLEPFKIDRTKTQMIVVSVNCNQNLEALLKQIDNVNVPDGIDFRIATSRFFSYGLYDETMLTPTKFKRIFTRNTKE